MIEEGVEIYVGEKSWIGTRLGDTLAGIERREEEEEGKPVYLQTSKPAILVYVPFGVYSPVTTALREQQAGLSLVSAIS